MDLSRLIKDTQEKGLMSIAPIRFVSRANPAFDMLAIMADTNPMDTKKMEGRLSQCQN